jgi:hypothetical protein
MISTPTTHTSVKDLIANRQAELFITDEELTLALEFQKQSVIRMIKQGSIKFPIQKISLLASAIQVDASDLLRYVMEESMPEVLSAVDQLLMPKSLNANEQKLLESYRHLSEGKEVVPMVVEGKSIIALVLA